MTVTMSVSISFEAETPEAGQEVVHAMNIPEGAQVNVNANVHLVAGVVNAEGVVAVPGPLEYEVVYRDAITGEYVTEEYAAEHPDTTVGESQPVGSAP